MRIFRKVSQMLDFLALDDDVTLRKEGGVLVGSTGGGGGGAPTDVDYLVGSSSGDLSAEIVVGTSPGGELGGTWASPTVDATHSGSSHATVQAAAEATAAAALSAHSSDTTGVHGIADTSSLVLTGDSRLSDSRAPSGAAGGVLGGTYPNPSFAADMATQAELDAHVNDTSAAHAASAVSFSPTGNIAATDAQAAIAEAATDAASALTTHEADTTSVHGITDTSALYRAGGTDVALADGGTGASLTDPNADRIMFWDDSAGSVAFLTPGTNLTITGTTLDASGGGSASTGLAVGTFYPASGGTTTAVGSSNIFAVRVWVPVRATFTKYLLRIGTASGNMDLGVYDSAGNAIRREGSFAVPSPTSTRVERTLGGGALTLDPGAYILACQFDNASATVGLMGTNDGQALGFTPSNTFPLGSTISLTVGGTLIALALLP